MKRTIKSGKAHRATLSSPASFPSRINGVDMARGVALALMICYHFCFDLNYFQLAEFDFYHSAFWLFARAMIVTLFLLLVGISLHLATANGLRRASYLRRLVTLVACAALVSAASYSMYPASGIFFGVLHFIALASLLGLFFTRFYGINLVTGVTWIAAGLLIQHPWFDQPWANWIGLMTHKPVTEDYVPLFPWFGVVLLGLFLGKSLTRSAQGKRPQKSLPTAYGNRMLALAGRHSLAIYMLHQPVLLGILYFSIKLKGYF
ncbi:MAG: heparan-alpha-glucosaminide N-acetyltransferase [Sulfuricella sp.]